MLAGLLLFGTGPSAEARAEESNDPGTGTGVLPRLYVLQFNRWGDLVNPTERDLLTQQLRGNPKIERILIISYGWANDGEASYAAYRGMIADIAASAEQLLPPERTAVIAVGWDSSQTGFRKLLNGLLPLPFVADALAYLPDRILFPLSFWSRAAMADRIGFGGLRSALNRILGEAYLDPERQPEIFLIGYSFGTRVVSSLLQDRMGILPVRGEAFEAAPHVAGAMLLQPAAVLGNLDESGSYPILVTQSRHDHANGLLFPLANIAINAYSFTAFEALFEHRVFEMVESTIGTTATGVTDIVMAPLPSRRSRDPEPEEARTDERKESRWSRFRYLARRSLAELVSIPATVVFTAASTPINYAYTQIHGFVTHPVNHIMDTFAQIPVVEVPVYLLDRALGREVPWGSRSKGLLDLGALHESVGRTITPRIHRRELPRVYSPAEVEEIAAGSGICRLPSCNGIFAVDASTRIRRGLLGYDLERPWVDFTVGWLDPVGAHTDYRNPEVVELMSLLMREASRQRQNPDEDR